MTHRRVLVVARKEALESWSNRGLVATFALLAFIFTAVPLAMASGLPLLVDDPRKENDEVALTKLLREAFPSFAGLSDEDQFRIIIMRQFSLLQLVLPVMGAMGIATYGIVGEKTSRSLEALLATPVTTAELLLGKCLAAAVPSVLATWLVVGTCAGGLRLACGGVVVRHVFDGPLVAMHALVTPLLAVFALGIGIVLSSRVNDARTAQQVGGMLVLPLVGAMMAQTAGIFLVGVRFVVVGAVVLFLLDVFVVMLGVAIFDREQILTRWK